MCYPTLAIDEDDGGLLTSFCLLDEDEEEDVAEGLLAAIRAELQGYQRPELLRRTYAPISYQARHRELRDLATHASGLVEAINKLSGWNDDYLVAAAAREERWWWIEEQELLELLGNIPDYVEFASQMTPRTGRPPVGEPLKRLVSRLLLLYADALSNSVSEHPGRLLKIDFPDGFDSWNASWDEVQALANRGTAAFKTECEPLAIFRALRRSYTTNKYVEPGRKRTARGFIDTCLEAAGIRVGRDSLRKAVHEESEFEQVLHIMGVIGQYSPELSLRFPRALWLRTFGLEAMSFWRVTD